MLRFLAHTVVFTLLCIFAGLPRYDLKAQGNSVITYTPEQGVCNYNTSGMIRDHIGRIWVSSGGGVSRYDGREWKCFGIQDGLISIVIYNLKEDKFGNIWLVYSGKRFITRIVNDKVFNYYFDKIIQDLYLNDDGTLSLLSWQDGVYATAKFNYEQPESTPWKKLPKDYTARSVHCSNNFICSPPPGSRLPWKLCRNGEFISIPPLQPLKSPENRVFYLDYQRDIKIFFKWLYWGEVEPFIMDGNKKLSLKPHFFTSPYGPTTKINADYVTFSFDDRYKHLYLIWKIGVNDYLLQEYVTSSFKPLNTIRFQSKYKPNFVTKDAAGNFWIGTERAVQKILCYQYSIPLGTTGLLNSVWTIQQSSDSNLWLGSFGEGLTIFDGYKFRRPPGNFNDLSKAQLANSTIRMHDGTMLFNVHSSKFLTTGVLAVKDKKWKWLMDKKLGIYFDRDRHGRLMVGTFSDGLYIFRDDKKLTSDNLYKVIDKKKGLKLDVVLAAVQDRYGRYWMGRASQGIAVYDPGKDTVINWLIRDKKKDIGAISIAEDRRGNLWFGGLTGLYFLKNRPDIEAIQEMRKECIKVGEEIFEKNELNEINEIELVDDSTLLVGYPKGYFLIDLNKFYTNPQICPLRGAFKMKNENYTLGSIEQNSFLRSKDGNYWLVTVDGIVSHNPFKYKPTNPPGDVFIDSMKVGNRLFTSFEDKIKLANEQRTLSLYFSVPVDSLLYHNLSFQYRLNNDDWSPLQRESQILFQNLNSGVYNLQIRAVKDGNYSPVKNISFAILPPLWLRWQVWLVSFIIFTLLGLYLYSRQRTIYRQKLSLAQKETEFELMNREKDTLRVSAIVNQLNPHFINNALQWLQVKMEDDVESISVIGRLAENINTVFRNSRKNISFHGLANELQLASNYLYIQATRFGPGLKYRMPELSRDDFIMQVDVPIMIIQIHVENAVEHGIRNTDTGDGEVSVTVREDGEYIVIAIEDNGVGREKAALLGSKGTQNGTTMLRELEKIYNKNNRLKISQTYYDGIFTEETGEKYGTRVVIRIPKAYSYKI
ncbi:MAG: histidine kinase [Saprospiraceae bacterium]|nr:histidine kinase [Saprospiraceae bacterium]